MDLRTYDEAADAAAERDEMLRQRDEMVRQRDEMVRERDLANARIAELDAQTRSSGS